MQSRSASSVAAAAGLLLLSGCGLVGSWRVVRVKPEEARFPFAVVTFADDGTYCAASSSGGRTSTSSGTYQWTGMKLTLMPQDRSPQTYSGYMKLGRKLVLTQNAAGKTSAVLEKQEDEKPAALP